MRKKRDMIIIVGSIILVAVSVIVIRYNITVNQAKKRFEVYRDKAEVVETKYGKVSYIDEGKGEIILSCHGICGGYDQAYDTLAEKTGTYRVLAPSRFGYPGSDIPKEPSVEKQVETFVELLDELKIDKVFVLATSAGGTSAIRFALMHPERTKGLILYCSGYPGTEKPDKKLTYEGPPAALCHDFPMWFFSPLFKPLMGFDSGVIGTILPMKERYDGIIFDSEINNTDMDNHYENYDMRNLEVPVLILHAKDDKLADYDKAENWAKILSNCTFLSFETGGHLMKGNSEAIDAALKTFIDQNK